VNPVSSHTVPLTYVSQLIITKNDLLKMNKKHQKGTMKKKIATREEKPIVKLMRWRSTHWMMTAKKQ
jgi:hypothetical protein